MLELTATEAFLEAVMRKYHFAQEDGEDFFRVGQAVLDAVGQEAGFWCAQYGDAPDLLAAALTLGKNVDILQDCYAQEGKLLECYMAEAFASELLLEGYRRFNEWVEAQGSMHVARYHFFGAKENYSLEEMPAVLEMLDAGEVSCNQACCLMPRKSVVFLARLTADEAVRCAGICADCGRKDCLNRSVQEEKEQRLRWPDLTERALPYGYARILGR